MLLFHHYNSLHSDLNHKAVSTKILLATMTDSHGAGYFAEMLVPFAISATFLFVSDWSH